MTRRGAHRGLVHAALHGPRAGGVFLFVLVSLCLLAALAGLGWYFLRGPNTPQADAPLLSTVTRGPYEHIVLEQGEVESGNNVEIRCEVRARNTYGPSTSIIDVILEGTLVKKDDWLVTFDSSALEQEQRKQKISVNTSEATMIQAKAVYDTAVISQKEYLEGTYKEQEQTILNEIFVAEEALKKAQLSHDSVTRLVARGLLTSLQLDGEKYRVDAATNVLQLAKRKLEVLEKYTKSKMLTQLESDIQATQVKWENEQDNYQEELTKLKEIEEQIGKCRVLAPQEGQVVYANVQSSRSGSEFVVEAGASVRENQVIIILPDPRDMRIKANVNESKVNLVKADMPVSIRIDAFGEETLDGLVTKVNNYAEPGNYWSSTSKQYATFIQVVNPPPELRVGLTAEVRIHVESRDNALQIPVQAVVERGGKTFCLVRRGDKWDTCEIVVSSTNSKTVALDERSPESLKPGETIVINPRQHLGKFDLSRFPKGTEPTRPSAAVVSTQKRIRSQPSPAAVVAEPARGQQLAGKPEPAVDREASRDPVASVTLLRQYDTNQDSRISREEMGLIPADLRQRLGQADHNRDGVLDSTEWGAVVAQPPASGDTSAGTTGGGG